MLGRNVSFASGRFKVLCLLIFTMLISPFLNSRKKTGTKLKFVTVSPVNFYGSSKQIFLHTIATPNLSKMQRLQLIHWNTSFFESISFQIGWEMRNSQIKESYVWKIAKNLALFRYLYSGLLLTCLILTSGLMMTLFRPSENAT